MKFLRILGQVGKSALKETIGINLDMLKKGDKLQSKSERKTHEIAVAVSQLVCSLISLWKLLNPVVLKKSIENEK